MSGSQQAVSAAKINAPITPSASEQVVESFNPSALAVFRLIAIRIWWVNTGNWPVCGRNLADIDAHLAARRQVIHSSSTHPSDQPAGLIRRQRSARQALRIAVDKKGIRLHEQRAGSHAAHRIERRRSSASLPRASISNLLTASCAASTASRTFRSVIGCQVDEIGDQGCAASAV
jgi:hypothetical protein